MAGSVLRRDRAVRRVTQTRMRVGGHSEEPSHRGGNLQFSIRLQLHLFLGICFIWALDLRAETGSHKWSKSDMFRYYTKPRAWHQHSRSRHTNGQTSSGAFSEAVGRNWFSSTRGTTCRCEYEWLKCDTENIPNVISGSFWHLKFIYLLWCWVANPFNRLPALNPYRSHEKRRKA